MRDYFESLDSIGKQRYSEKLALLFLDVGDDPFDTQNAEKYVDESVILINNYMGCDCKFL